MPARHESSARCEAAERDDADADAAVLTTVEASEASALDELVRRGVKRVTLALILSNQERIRRVKST
jgi:hypothetical protein